jgi:hypothetical protein
MTSACRDCGETHISDKLEAISDFVAMHHGSICLLYPKTDAASEWVKDNLPDNVMWWNKGVVIEPRHIGKILDGAEQDGMLCLQLIG